MYGYYAYYVNVVSAIRMRQADSSVVTSKRRKRKKEEQSKQGICALPKKFQLFLSSSPPLHACLHLSAERTKEKGGKGRGPKESQRATKEEEEEKGIEGLLLLLLR